MALQFEDGETPKFTASSRLNKIEEQTSKRTASKCRNFPNRVCFHFFALLFASKLIARKRETYENQQVIIMFIVFAWIWLN